MHNAEQRRLIRKAFLISKAQADAIRLALQSFDKTTLKAEEMRDLNEFREDLVSRWGV
jgi:hypothetical protein